MPYPSKSAVICLFLLLLSHCTSIQAQNIMLYGTQYDSAGTALRILRVDNPMSASGTVSIALNVAGFSQAGGTILNAPAGTVISGTSLNAAAWNPVTKRVYFRDSQGAGNLYYWSAGTGATNITYVASPATLMAGGATNLADSATYYNGAYWYGEDGTDALYRYDLTAGTVRRFAGISGATGRAYDFGDIAVNSAGILFINGNRATNQNNVLDRIDISGVTASVGTPTGFAQVQAYNNNYDGVTQQIGFDDTLTNMFMLQSISASGGGFPERTWHTVNTSNGNMSNTIWTSSLNFSDLTSAFIAIPEPSTYFLLLGTPAIFGSVWVLRNRKQLEQKASENEGNQANTPSEEAVTPVAEIPS